MRREIDRELDALCARGYAALHEGAAVRPWEELPDWRRERYRRQLLAILGLDDLAHLPKGLAGQAVQSLRARLAARWQGDREHGPAAVHR